MPTIRVSIKFNSKVLSGKEALTYEKHILSVKYNHDNISLPLETRWFHYEFWSENDYVENYAREALFGRFEDVDEEKKVFPSKANGK